MTAAERSEMLTMTQRMVTEYAGAVPAGAVIRCVARCRHDLYRAGVRSGLTVATESMARRVLTDRLAMSVA